MKHSFLFFGGVVFFFSLSGCKTSTENTTNTVKYSIAGTVRSYSGNHFDGVTQGVVVRLSYPDTIETTTNSFGNYRFDNVPSGNYFLYFTKLGLAPYSKNLHIDSNMTIDVSLSSALLDTGVLMIHVQDQSKNPLQGVKIIGISDSLYTNISGDATFKYRGFGGSWQFKFSSANYIPLTKLAPIEYGQIRYDTTVLVHQ